MKLDSKESFGLVENLFLDKPVGGEWIIKGAVLAERKRRQETSFANLRTKIENTLKR
jgi:hypothetical protein